ncbi:hypothetical protein DY000_02016660 [Brassica cretica]|uniref:Uncharacterized protein n=1 Tax=Brassica cretica TaxID=69181 RepID=A0ABQ7D246_BRACR|nr:hypothetical protein DY000_02016660 [Brassica cretica]
MTVVSTLTRAKRNFTGKTRAITVTNILSLETPPPIEASVGNRFTAMFEETLQVGYDVCEPSKSCGDFVDEGTKRTCGSDKPETAKRPKCGSQSFHLSSQKLQALNWSENGTYVVSFEPE